MPYVELNGANIFYTDEGSGPPVLLVHGWSCDGTDWAWQTPALKGAGYRCIVPDLRGHGRSSVPEEGYTPRGYAADLAALLRHLGTGPVVAMGHSMGGAAVVALAVEYPELVRAIVPVDSAYGQTGSPEQLAALINAVRAPEGVAFAQQMFSTMYGADAEPHLREIHMRRIAAMHPEVRWKAMEGIFAGPDQFCMKAEAEAYLPRMAAPALAFRAGSQDPAGVAAWEGALLQHPKSSAIAWEGFGHWLHQERPEEFNRVVLEWLGGLEG